MAWTVEKLQSEFRDLSARQVLTIIAIARGRLRPWDYPDHPWWGGRFDVYRFMDISGGRKVEAKMAAFDAILDTCGVEAIDAAAIGDDDVDWDSFWCDTVALYCNAGDTYASTILWDRDAGRFRITTWGDWVESRSEKPDHSGDGHFGCDHGGL